MKKLIFIAAVAFGISLGSCDKVENPYPPTISYDLDTTIYPGAWSDYQANQWPDFSTLPDEDPERNALLEDYTGHNCSFCPGAGAAVHDIHEANPSRAFVASIHATNEADGWSSFQALVLNDPQGKNYTIDFMNPDGLYYGSYFGTVLTNSGFFGNPAVTINRTSEAGEYFTGESTWESKTNAVLASSLKVGIKAKVNYYETPKKGLFLHTEVTKLDAGLTNPLAMVVYLIEDSIVGPQNVLGTHTPNYVHRDIFRGTIDGNPWGRDLSDDLLENQKYYLDYSYIVPNQLAPSGQSGSHNAENMHLLIYVYDKITLEIYQVIKKKIQ